MIARFFFMPVFYVKPNRLYRVWTRSGRLGYNTDAMRLAEYRSKEFLLRRGIPVPRGAVVETPAGAAAEAERLGGRVALKAQVAAGGRAKAGGILFALGPEDARAKAETLLRTRLVTPQTGGRGSAVRRILVEEASPLLAEFYVGAALDRPAGRIILLASPFGGTDIEETARIRPEAVFREDIDPFGGLKPYQARRLSFALGLTGEGQTQAAAVFTAVAAAFLEMDAVLIEINPLGLIEIGCLLALDAKIELDDNALFRHPEFLAGAEDPEAGPAEIEAARSGLRYVRLDGDIGCLVNGAGLAMATMDIIQHHGGRPANFLDVGGGAQADKVAAALRIILSDKNVKAVLFNIFGGITRCDEVARGILAALKEVPTSVPMVARLVGTNEAEGRAILADAHMGTAETLDEAAQKAVKAAHGEITF